MEQRERLGEIERFVERDWVRGWMRVRGWVRVRGLVRIRGWIRVRGWMRVREVR